MVALTVSIFSGSLSPAAIVVGNLPAWFGCVGCVEIRLGGRAGRLEDWGANGGCLVWDVGSMIAVGKSCPPGLVWLCWCFWGVGGGDGGGYERLGQKQAGRQAGKQASKV
jgi:hypothetical protein